MALQREGTLSFWLFGQLAKRGFPCLCGAPELIFPVPESQASLAGGDRRLLGRTIKNNLENTCEGGL